MAQSFHTNLSNVAAQYTKQLNVPVTTATIKQQLQQNPYYPSLYSLSNVFDKLNIPNQAFEVTENDLAQLQPPFIAYCIGQTTGKDFVLVTNIDNNTVSYIAEGKKSKQLSKANFLKQWQKLVFAAEATPQSGDKEYAVKLKAEKKAVLKRNGLYAGVVLLLGLLVGDLVMNAGNAFLISAAAITITKLLGVAATILLLLYEVDKTNSFVKNICTAGKLTNCSAVLNSKAGKIFGISWAEAGFFYFAATAIFLWLPGMAFTAKIAWLAIAATAAAPYIVFSIYYQYKVVKQWCPLCLAVQAILLLELIWAIINLWANQNYSLSSMLSSSPFPFPLGRIGWAFLLPVVCWYFLRPILLAAKNAPIYNAAYKRLLYNPEIFNGLLQQQPAAPNGWQNLGIDIGNPNAANTIIKVCNPYCGPCAKAHPVLEEIVKHNTDVKVKVIFTATNAETDRAGKPVKHLLAIAAKNNLQLTEQALDDWYLADKKDYEAFAKKYPVDNSSPRGRLGGALDLMSNWCTEAEINATPTIFINGRRLPETYSINELKNIF
jgi:uncharacterized membrane protein